MAIFRRITESGNIRKTELGDERHLENSISQGTPGYVDSLSAKINIISNSDLGATLFIQGRKDLGASIGIVTISDLGASIEIPSTSDLNGKLTIPSSSNVGAKIKIVSYITRDFFAKITVLSTSDIKASCYIIPYIDLSSKIKVVRELKAKIFIPGRNDELSGYIDVYDTSFDDLYAKTKVIHAADISGKITIGEYENLWSRVNVTIEQQKLNSSITIEIIDEKDISSIINVDTTNQELKSKATVIASGNAGLGATVTNESTLQSFFGRVTVMSIGEADIGGQIEPIENVPTVVCPSGYIIPSGYPNAPTFTTEWLDENGIATPPSGAQIIPSGVWQEEEEILFVWSEPSDWGFGATGAGYTVAWNDDEDYIVTDNDQFVPDNYIDKSWFDSGYRYFHLRARNSYGHLGPQCSCNILINQIPSQTGPEHYIDHTPNPSGISNSSRPTFFWGKSTDADQLDILKYELQIEPSGTFPEGTPASLIITDIAQTQAGSINEFKLNEDLIVGDYTWRVRANDTKQYGAWSDWQLLTLVPAVEDIGAKITLVTPWLENFGAKINIIQYDDLPSSIYVVPYDDLAARIGIVGFKDLNAKLYVQQGSNIDASITVEKSSNLDLYSKTTIFHASDIDSSINILPFNNLNATINVDTDLQELMGSFTVVVPSGSNLGAVANIKGDLKGKIEVELPASGDLQSSINVLQDSFSNIPVKIHIIEYQDLNGKIFIPGRKDIDAIIDVQEDIPDSVIVTSDVAENTWQTNNNPNFYWTEPYDPFSSVYEYYIAFNQDPNYTVTDSDQRTNGLTDDRFIFDAGEYYFHIRARNQFGNWNKDTTHYGIWFNHIPGIPDGPLYVEGQTTPLIGTVTPKFSWKSSVDQDQLDVLTYHVQIATDFEMTNIVSEQFSIPQTGNSSRTEFTLDENNKLNGEGGYFWRVRAYDGREYSGWSNISGFTIAPVIENFGAKLTIPIEDRSRLGAKISIIANSNLNASISIIYNQHIDLLASAIVSYKSDFDLMAIARVASKSFIGASINIIQYKELPSTIDIIKVPGNEDIGAKIELDFAGDYELRSKLNIVTKKEEDFGGYIGIIPYDDNLSSKITTYHSDNFSWIDNFNKHIGVKLHVLANGHKDFGASMFTIADHPGAVVVHANIEEATWQSENLVQFTWDPAPPGLTPIVEYHTHIDKIPDTEIGDINQNTIGFSRGFDMEYEGGAGIYYFHIAAKNSANKYGPTTHFSIYYNHTPSTPTVPMLINNNDSFLSFPIIGATVNIEFEWGQSIDEDELDSISYHMQIAKQENFGLTDEGSSSIIYEEQNIQTYRHMISGGVFIPSGTYYWRVKAYDGNQYSDNWSPTGHFVVNTPPPPPTNLFTYRA